MQHAHTVVKFSCRGVPLGTRYSYSYSSVSSEGPIVMPILNFNDFDVISGELQRSQVLGCPYRILYRDHVVVARWTIYCASS